MPAASFTRHSTNPPSQVLVDSACRVIGLETEALQTLAARIDESFAAICRTILASRGRVAVSGMGKSGHIARKIAATLASTGTPAFFVHPGEASHGDLGMIQPQDLLLALSHSGETDELLCLIPALKRQGTGLIALTGQDDSTLARQADLHFNTGVGVEACPLGLAPTTSTTTTLALGDALAVALLEARGFTADDFARSHPAGSLGRRLLVRIGDLMHTGTAIPRVSPQTPLDQALLEMSRARLGMTAVVDAAGQLLGVLTDGDLRRALDDHGIDLRATKVAAVMTPTPKTIAPEQLASEAARLMQEYQIHALLVVDAQRQLVGALNIHDLLRARVV